MRLMLMWGAPGGILALTSFSSGWGGNESVNFVPTLSLIASVMLGTFACRRASAASSITFRSVAMAVFKYWIVFVVAFGVVVMIIEKDTSAILIGAIVWLPTLAFMFLTALAIWPSDRKAKPLVDESITPDRPARTWHLRSDGWNAELVREERHEE